ncbi:MAG: CARDB domain-containing protein [Bacteroidales bacterium]|nr:CARDB domain-containing protein [Bacteroidales bacterium]
MRKLLTLTLAMLISVSWLGAQDYSAKKNMRRVDFSKEKEVTLSKEKEEFSRIEAENYIPSTPEEQISFKSSKGEVTIGTGTVTSLNLPIACDWGYNYSQTIYYQTEIGEAGDITKLYYKWNGSGDAENIKLWNVYMGHTPKTVFESTTDWIPFSELTEVFNGEIEFETAVDNWIEITLSTPFAYDNTNNLVIAVDENTPGYSSLPKFLETSTTGVNRGILYRNDSTNPDPENPPTASSVVAGYANIKLRFPPSIPYLFDVSAETGATVMAGGSYDYAATVKNMGINADAFTLAITGSGAWTYEFFESDGTTPLVNPINIASDVSANFVIKVTVPATGVADGDTDTQEFSVTSAEGGKAVENFSITTTATTPLYLPIYDGFEEGNTNQQPVASWDMVKVTGTEGWLANSAQTSYNRTPRTGSFNAHLKYSNTAWLFTKKPVALEAEKLYRFSLYARQDAASGASITLKYGTSASDAGMTFDIKEATDVVNGDYQLIEGEFSPDTDGGYYLGILGETTYSPWYLSIDDIAVTIVPANDVSVSQLVTPSGNLYQGNTYPMSVTVTNEGTNPQPAGVSVSFKQEGVEFATAATTVDLATGESEVVTANYTATALGTFAIEASVAADENPANDMVSGSITIFQAGALFEDFEGDFLPNGWTETATENSWSQEDRDINGLSAFLIHDISNAEEMLITPKLTLDGTVNELSYWADDGNGSYGYGSAQIQIKYSADGIDWTDVGDLAILDADDPVQFIVDLSAIPNGDYYFAFATSSTFEHEGYNSLTAIDDVAGPVIADLLANDLSIAALDYPREFIYDGEDLSIFVNVKNVGTAFRTGVELTLSVDGVEAETHTLGSLGYGQSEIVEFSFIAVAGRYTFTATLAADDNLENNTRTTQGVVVAEGQLAEGFEGTWVPTLWEAETGWRYWDQDWTAQWEGVRSAACGNALGISDSKLITPFLQIGENEELNFYATVGNEIEVKIEDFTNIMNHHSS